MIFRKLFKLLLLPFSIFVIFLISLIRPIILIRFGIIPTERFGHLATNLEIYNSEKIILDKKSFYIILDIFCFAGRFGNKFLMKMIRRKYILLPEIFISTVIFLIKKLHFHQHLVPKYSYGYDIYNLIYPNQTRLKFTNKELLHGYALLKKINISSNDKIVTFFIRDESYNKEIFGEFNDYHKYRNSEIRTYQPAANYLSQKNYKIIRMGRLSKESLIEDKNIIDYSSSNIKCDFLDLFISSISNFFITNNTGLETPSTHIFRKSGVIANFLPYLNINFYKWVPYSILLPKKIKKNGMLLTYSEIFTSSLSGYIDTKDYKKDNLEILDNTAEEILEATKEYISYQNDKSFFLKGEDVILQKKFWEIYNKNFNLKFFRYTEYYEKDFNLENHKITAIISPNFLRKNINQLI